MADDTQGYDIAAVRQLLTAAFTAEELRRFCVDRPTFRPVLAQFGLHHGLDDMADEVIDFCRTKLLFGKLLAEAQAANPEQYEHFAPYQTQVDSEPAKPTEPPQPPTAVNPFRPLTGRIGDPALVFGREREIARAVEFVQAGSSVALIGPAGVGKSSLLTRLLAVAPERLGAPWETAYLNLEPIADEEQLFEALCDELQVSTCRGYALSRALHGRRVLLAMDEVEKMAWDGFTRGLRAELRGLAGAGDAPLKLVLAARAPLDRFFADSEGATSPLYNVCVQVEVGPWDKGTARAFLASRLAGSRVALSEAETAQLVERSNGHPQRLVQAAFELFGSKAGGAW